GRLACKDGDPACDVETEPGVCALPVQVCFGHADERLAKCTARDTDDFVLRAPASTDPSAAAILAAVGALGASTVSGGSGPSARPRLAAGTCPEVVTLHVPVRGKVKLRTQTSAAGGKPRDPDVVRLSCTP